MSTALNRPRPLARLAGTYEWRAVGERVRLAPCEYEGAIDRGRLSDRPFFWAEPVE